jgi:hypothetical protein
MKGFLKFVGTVVVVFAVIVGVIALIDHFRQKNKIKDGYLVCDVPGAEDDE